MNRLDAVLSPADLEAAPLALLEYAWRLPPDDAASWLRAFLERPDAREHLPAWIMCAGKAHWFASDSAKDDVQQTLADALVAWLDRERLSDRLHDALRALATERFALPARPRLVQWLIRHAGAGDAALLAHWFEHHPDDARADPNRVDLAVALLERGSAELRRGANLPLAAGLVMEVDRHRPALRELALRTLLRNERATEAERPVKGKELVWSALARAFQHSAHSIEELLPVVERVLIDGAAPSLASDTAVLFGWAAFAEAAWKRSDVPRVGDALLARLAADADAGGGVQSAIQQFEVILRGGRDWSPPTFRDPRALAAAKSQVFRLSCDQRDRETLGPRLAAWAEALTDAHVALHGLARGARYELGSLEQLAGWPLTMTAVRRSLERHLGRDPSVATRVAARILAAHPDESNAVVPAILALPERAVRLAVDASGPPLDELVRELERALLRSWVTPIGGVDVGGLLAGVKHLALDQLSNERQIEHRDDTFCLDRSSMQKVVAGRSGDEALALAALWAAHEMLHEAQGLAEKETVAVLRSTGGETTLLHVDLAADHAAALWIEQALPGWSLVALKELHGANVLRYPAGPNHIVAARARKVGRVIALRLDWLVRKHGLVSRDKLGAGYAFADFGPGGGKIVLLASGPPWAVLGHAALSDDATVLSRAADEHGPSLPEIDTALLAIARRALGR